MRVTVQQADSLSPAQRQVVTKARLAALLRQCGERLKLAADAEVTVRLTGDSELHELNRRFRNEDKPTDVLAFPDSEIGIGDIAISVERAMEQAPREPVSELRLLTVHGLLHCLGHDHDTPERAKAMTDATRGLLPGEDVPDLIADTGS